MITSRYAFGLWLPFRSSRGLDLRNLEEYSRKRTGDYEEIYDKPERRDDLSDLSADLRARLWDANLKVYGVQKVWKQLRREGFKLARCTVSRLMAAMGLRGAVRGRRIKTTVPAGAENRPEDLVQRDFRTGRPNQLWSPT